MDHVICRYETEADRVFRRDGPRWFGVIATCAQHLSDEGANGVLAQSGAEIEDAGCVTGESLALSHIPEFSHQAGLADARFPAEAYGLAPTGIKASIQGAGKLAEFCLTAKKTSLGGGRAGHRNAGDPPDLTSIFDPAN